MFKEVNTSPLFKVLWGYLLIILGIISLVLLNGCGARRVETNLIKSNNTQLEQSSSKGAVFNSERNYSIDFGVKQTDKQDDYTYTKTTETFDSSGRINSRTTERTNQKSTDKSSETKQAATEKENKSDSTFNNETKKKTVVTSTEKNKNSDANNNALYWTIFGIVVVAILCFFIYKRITRKK